MNVFDLFGNKYPPDNDLRKPTAEVLEQFQRNCLLLRGLSPTEMGHILSAQ